MRSAEIAEEPIGPSYPPSTTLVDFFIDTPPPIWWSSPTLTPSAEPSRMTDLPPAVPRLTLLVTIRKLKARLAAAERVVEAARGLTNAAQAALDQADHIRDEHFGGLREPPAQERYDAQLYAVLEARGALAAHDAAKP